MVGPAPSRRHGRSSARSAPTLRLPAGLALAAHLAGVAAAMVGIAALATSLALLLR